MRPSRPSVCGQPHCPYHDGDARFSCHLAKLPSGRAAYTECIPALPGFPTTSSACTLLRNRTVVFMGDSTSREHYNAFRCALLQGVTDAPVRADIFNKSLRWKDHLLWLQYLQCHAFPGCGAVCMLPAGQLQGGSPDVRFQLARLLEARLSSARSVLIVANQGLWHVGSAGYGARTVRKLAVSADAAVGVWRALRERNDCLLWRETSPQAFNTPSGAYPGRVDKYQGWYGRGGCTPHTEVDSPWEPVHDIFEAAQIRVIRVWNESRVHHSAYISNRTEHALKRGADCTHFCTPGVYDLWVQLLLGAMIQYCPNAYM